MNSSDVESSGRSDFRIREYMNRESWLEGAVHRLRLYFKDRGFEIPEVVKISCGWPSTRALAKKNKRLGECWETRGTVDGVHQIYISPLLTETLKIMEVLAHELLHASLPDGTGHKKLFKQAAEKLGYEPDSIGRIAGKDLAVVLVKAAGEEPYPQAGINLETVVKGKQTTRMSKIICKANEEHLEDYILRASNRAIEIGLPNCPCGKQLELVDGEE